MLAFQGFFFRSSSRPGRGELPTDARGGYHFDKASALPVRVLQETATEALGAAQIVPRVMVRAAEMQEINRQGSAPLSVLAVRRGLSWPSCRPSCAAGFRPLRPEEVRIETFVLFVTERSLLLD